LQLFELMEKYHGICHYCL